ncbi:hypothetical protein [Methylovorus glucosotrophus]|uniref:Uncharacterized protein n=1 Tax=Methylovorus glucosotrophus (strain SIP3-4) TaxID=582744 RepID=C6XEN8_METGS|nr:hypothetical protein [Methylovorus glucosotrophus]ACT52095.1 hypothetical protein Msip34_2871 [Methylovorus glucosotrophus SIP3-4]
MTLNKMVFSLLLATTVSAGALYWGISHFSKTESLIFEGKPSKDSPSVIEAKVVSNKDGVFLKVNYREGKIFPAINAPVSIANKLGGYEVERLDTHEKYLMMPVTKFGSLYICTECVHEQPGKMIPMYWVKD